MERYYRFAGITFRVCGPEDQMYRAENALAPFVTEDTEAACTYEFQLVDQLSAPRGKCVFQDSAMWVYESNDTQIRYQGPLQEGLSGAYLRICRQGYHCCVEALRRVMPDYVTTKTVLNSLEAEHWIAQRQGILLHASFICYEGNAIVFTAPSGTGKSTQAALWNCLRGAEQMNGDRVAVMLTENGVCACGVPFSGSSGICKNASAPLKAIVFLSQAPQTEIVRLKGLKAFRSVWEGCSINAWNQQDVDLSSRTVMQILSSVPVFHLACTPDESAVIALEQALEQMR